MSKDADNPFKWRHYQAEIILLNVRWYLRFTLSYRDLEEMMMERGLSVDQTTIFRWVRAYAPELDKRCRPYLKQTNDSWRVDETYIKVHGKWMCLYRAVDSNGYTLDFLLNETRSTRAAKRFSRKILNNIVEQDHRCVKRQFKAAMGYGTYPTAWRTIRGIEADHVIKKGQIVGVGKSDILGQKQFVHELFGLVA